MLLMVFAIIMSIINLKLYYVCTIITGAHMPILGQGCSYSGSVPFVHSKLNFTVVIQLLRAILLFKLFAYFVNI